MVRCTEARPPLTTICGLRSSGAVAFWAIGTVIENSSRVHVPLILGGFGECNAAFDSGNEKWSVPPNEAGDFMLKATLARRAGAFALAALLVAAVSGSAPAQELKAWRHSLIAPKADAGFFYMAAKRGFFEREGLKVETLEVKDDAIGIKALLSGEVDSHEGTAGAIAAAARGADVKILGCPWHGVPYVLLARPGITNMEQLRGKSIASSSPGTPPEMMARASLALAKIPASEVKLAAV